jgi:hypothetical protein
MTPPQPPPGSYIPQYFQNQQAEQDQAVQASSASQGNDNSTYNAVAGLLAGGDGPVNT